MASTERVGTLKIGQDLEFQRRDWVVQRVGWVVMALMIVAALAGLLGPGPLSKASAGGADAPLRLEYNRFVRYLAPTALRVQLVPGQAENGQARVWIDRSYLDAVRIQSITPEPEKVESEPDRMIFTFSVAASERPVVAAFHFEPEQIGPLDARAGLDEQETVSFSQFVYP